jgi:hypothetical protein
MRNDLRPFLGFLSFPKPLLPLLMKSTIAPEMDVNIKRRTNESLKLVDCKANQFARDSKSL